MTGRRVVLVTVPAGLVLAGVGAWLFAAGHRATAIVIVVAGLACLRAAYWVGRIRLLTRVGRELHVPDDDPDGAGSGPSS